MTPFTAFQQVNLCVRNKSETLPTFFDRFHRLALNYLNASRSSTHFQFSSILALQLLVNSRLPPSVLLTAKSIALSLIAPHSALYLIRILAPSRKYLPNFAKLATLSLFLLHLHLRLLPLVISLLRSLLPLPIICLYLRRIFKLISAYLTDMLTPSNPLLTVFLPPFFSIRVSWNVSSPMLLWFNFSYPTM